jgi:CHAT domain-containing protein/tetratricopeptide (TPR) repeat protein
MYLSLYPQGLPVLYFFLMKLVYVIIVLGSYGEARGYLERALAMYQSLYPQGHPGLAFCLNNLGALLKVQGSYGEARGYLERALAMREALYPRDRYPQGHPDLAQSLNNLSELLADQRSYDEARVYCVRALVMREALYPQDRYPQGHPDLANSLNNLGALHTAHGSIDAARVHLERALVMRQALYPQDRYPQGHPDLALCLNSLGYLLLGQGSYVEARGYYERALAMRQALYPQDRYPQGHPDLAHSLNNLGYYLLQAQGSYGEAAVLLRQSTDMHQALARTLLAATSEAEAMSYLATLTGTLQGLISSSLRLPGSADETYRRIWDGKSSMAQVLHDRQAATLNQVKSDPGLRRTVTAWRETRARLARLILATADGRGHPERDRLIKELSSEKDRLERELAAAVPEFARKRALERSGHGDLLKTLPEGAAVIDLVQFKRFEQDPQVKGAKGTRWPPGYVGFVLCKGRPVRMVDLGPAAPIDDAVSQWRQAIVHGQDSPAAADLRKLAWEPLARHLPKETTTVYLAPDGALCYIPWVALPGDRPGTVLLEQYALATIPYAPFLLDRLTAPKPPGHDGTAGLLLAVGGVAYGQAPRPVDDERARLQLLAARPAETKRGGENGWADLPGTRQELDAISRLAASRQILRLQDAEAGTARVLLELPRARWAHIGTHGFFADPSVRSVLTPDPRLFTQIGTERIGAGLRNPLVLSGLVLAGANLPRSEDDVMAHDDRGILTAETIAGLDLSGLDLAVLSACETGLGLVGGGEGVFGLQRAFHLAGAQNVIASLWKVDDQATAALMEIFYDRLWRQGKPPIEALREAQLALYRNPELIGKLVAARGTPNFDKVLRATPNFDKTVQRPEPAPSSDGSSAPHRAPARQWAAFVLSGDGY